MKEPEISVGIMSAPKIEFSLYNSYQFNETTLTKGDYNAHLSKGKIDFQGKLYNEIILQANDVHSDSFKLKDAVIGIDLHWERKEDQQYKGHFKHIMKNALQR